MKKNSFLVVLGLILSITAFSQHKGTLTQYNVKIGNCSYSSLTVKYDIGHFFGEPTVNGTYKVTGNSNCSLPSSTTIWLKIEQQGGNGYGYIKLSPTVPDVNGGYGYNTTGSPDWKEFICGYRGTENYNCLSENNAKKLYQTGKITSFLVAW